MFVIYPCFLYIAAVWSFKKSDEYTKIYLSILLLMYIWGYLWFLAITNNVSNILARNGIDGCQEWISINLLSNSKLFSKIDEAIHVLTSSGREILFSSGSQTITFLPIGAGRECAIAYIGRFNFIFLTIIMLNLSSYIYLLLKCPSLWNTDSILMLGFPLVYSIFWFLVPYVFGAVVFFWIYF